MKLNDAVQLAATLAVAYLGWKVYQRVSTTGAKVGEAVSATVFEILNPPGSAKNPARGALESGRTIKVLNGTAVSVDTATGTDPRFYDWTAGGFRPASGVKLPANWRSAPEALPGFSQLKASGKPWYTPWDGKGLGLQSPFLPK